MEKGAGMNAAGSGASPDSIAGNPREAQGTGVGQASSLPKRDFHHRAAIAADPSPSAALVAGSIDVSDLTEAQATLLMPLWARAMESRREQPLLRDALAERIVANLDFDFSMFHRKSVPVVDYCLRASLFDQLVQQFLRDEPHGAVVEVGVGLDTRFSRLAPEHAVWTEVDLPAVAAVRRRFFSDCAQRKVIAGSLLEEQWMDQVAARTAGRPTLFVIEGVFYFFSRAQLRTLFQRLADRFPQGQLVFDAQSPLLLAVSNWRHPLRDSRLQFSLSDPRELLSWDQRLRVEQVIGFGDMPYYQHGMPRLPRWKRWTRRAFPPLRRLFKVVRMGW